MTDTNQNRPTVMDDLSESQLKELEFQFDEDDRDEFDTLVTSYGWSAETGRQVWSWLQTGERASGSGQ